MAKISLTDITGGYLSAGVYNANNQIIEDAIDDALSRTGLSPNQMEAQLDMNSNRIVNLLDAVTASEPVTLRQMADFELTGVDPSTIVGITYDVYTANGADTVYNTSETAPNTAAVIVTLDGVTQEPGADYSVSGNQVTFSSAPPNGAKIVLRNIGYSLPTGNATTTVTPTFPQTLVEADEGVSVVNSSYPPGYVERYGGVADGATNNAPYIENGINGRQPVRFWNAARTDARTATTLDYDYASALYYKVVDAYIDSNSIYGPASLTGNGETTHGIFQLGRYRDQPVGHQWMPRWIREIYFNGKAREDIGCVLQGEDGALMQYANSWNFDQCMWDRCHVGIYKPEGNFGNSFRDCSGVANNYHYVALGRSTSSISHPGNDTFEKGEWSGSLLCGFLIDGDQTLGCGSTVFRDTIIEGNLGFGVYIKDYNTAANPILFDNVWFESNASESTVDISEFVPGATAVTPRDCYFENCDYVVMRNCPIREIEIKDSTVIFEDCHLEGTISAITIAATANDDNQQVRLLRCHMNSWGEGSAAGTDKLVVESLGTVKNTANTANNRCWLAPERTSIVRGAESAPFNGVVLESSTFEEGGDWGNTGAGADVSPDGFVDGLTFPTAAQYTFVASNGYVSPAEAAAPATTASKWYVITQEVKVDSGLANIDALKFGSSTNFTRGDAEAMLTEGQWHTIANVCKLPTGGTTGIVRPWIVMGSGGNATVSFGAFQMVEFDTHNDAVDFYNSRVFCHKSDLPKQTRIKREDTTRATTTTATADPELANFRLDADTWYRITGMIMVADSTATADYKAGFNWSQTPQYIAVNQEMAGSTDVMQETDGLHTAYSMGTTPEVIRVDGIFHTNASTGGVLDYEWAQNTSTSATTKLKKGSFLTVEKAFDPS